MSRLAPSPFVQAGLEKCWWCNVLTQILNLLPADCASWGNLCLTCFLPLSLSWTFTPPFIFFSDCLKKTKAQWCNFFLYCPVVALLSASLKMILCVQDNHTHKPLVSSFWSHFSHNTQCSLAWKMPIEWMICHWVSQESKAKMLTHVAQKHWRHKGWWNLSPLADRGENCAENVSQIK